MSTTTPIKPNAVRIKQAATSDIAAVAARLNATIDDQLPEGYPRAREDGIAWARDHATADELRNLVENFEPGPDGNLDKDRSWDNPHWREFVAGAEEVLDLDAAGPLPNATVDDQQAEAEEYQYQRGCGEGIAWARDYATADELRDLVENFEPGPDGNLDMDDSLCDSTSDKEHVNAVRVSYWRGFVDGAEEVLSAAGPLLNDPVPHGYLCFVKWLLEGAP